MYTEKLYVSSQSLRQYLSVRNEDASGCILYINRPLTQPECDYLLNTDGVPWFDGTDETQLSND